MVWLIYREKSSNKVKSKECEHVLLTSIVSQLQNSHWAFFVESAQIFTFFSIWRIPFSFDVLRASNYGIFTVNKVTRVVFYFLGFIEFIQRLSFQENSSCQIFFVEAKKFQQPIKVPVENDQKASAENRIFSFWKFSLTIYGKYKYSF